MSSMFTLSRRFFSNKDVVTRSRLTLFALITLVAQAGGQIKFSSQVSPLFSGAGTGACNTCHAGATAPGGLNLSGATDARYTEVAVEISPSTSASRVNTGTPSSSLILTKPSNTSAHGGGLNATWGVGQSSYNTTLTWIQEGAFRFVKPTSVQATAATGTQASLAWAFTDDGQTGFRIERKIGAGSFSFLTNVSASSRSYNDNTVSPNTSYTYQIRVENSVGNSGYETSNAVTTPDVAPAAPINLQATAASSNQVDLTWNDNSNNETGFRIERKIGNGSFSLLANVNANATSHSDNSANPNTTYTYQIRAENTAGNSNFTTSNAVTTPDVAPAAPTNLQAAAVSGNQIDLSWNDNSNNETGFRIDRKIGTGSFSFLTNVGANSTSYSDNTAGPTTSYTYRVRAENAVGNSNYATSNAVTTPDVAPTAPTNLQAATVASNQVDLTWNDNSNNETGFRIERKVGNGSFSLLANVNANATSHSDNTANPNTTYTYQVRAENAIGNSNFATSNAVTTPDVAPTAPTNLQAAVVSSNQVDLTWNDNSNNETGFRIERKVGNGSFSLLANVNADATSYSDNTASPNTTYTYQVRAENAIGNSSFATSNAVTTPDVAPTAPTNLQTAAVSSNQVDLTWNDNSNNETGFRIERKVGSGSFSLLANVNANATSHSDNTANPNTTYTYQVRAENAIGNSNFATSNAVTTPDVAPAAPTNLQAAAVSSNQVDLAWNDNSNNETGFRIERKVGNGSFSFLANVNTDATSYSDNTANPNTTYTYQVRAENAIGNSSYATSNAVTTPDVAPTAPTNLQAIAISGKQVDLVWIDNSNNETGFRIERREGAGAFILLANASADSTAYSDTTVSPNTSYTFQIRAENGAGNSDFAISNEITTPPITSVDDKSGAGAPTHFTLKQNYPNPFNPSTKIGYALPVNSRITLTIHGLLGQTVRILVEGNQSTGIYEVVWDGRDEAGQMMPSGIYFYTLSSERIRLTHKLILLK